MIGLLLASPPIAAWAIRDVRASSNAPQQMVSSAANQVTAATTKVPVEIVAKGSDPKWVYVEVENQSVPEPSAILLIGFGSLLILRRKRTN
ncbi:MAG: PEP-CTERM sorting domain-containing protein [Gloeobacteraceae cyanobacterium ES-bin-144]|nr:PEP-CTERM sorting domain-containing protein [Verrucomicrobiales bacterium]